MSPIALAQNEVTVNPAHKWKDILGEQYHFPNQYRNIIQPGTPFVYYRGVRRTGGKRGIAEYIGCGVVGDVWRDDSVPGATPKKNWAWFCQITEYVPFPRPVPAKANGKFLEVVKAGNHWLVGVRRLSQETYEQILSLAGAAGVEPLAEADFAPPLAEVILPELSSDPLLLPQRLTGQAGGGSQRGYSQRYSRNAKLVGDRAEEIALEYIKANAAQLGATNIVWRARQGETPGWDIDYCLPDGTLIAVEVKGSAAAFFTSVDVTNKEWQAANELGDRYHLYLVAECLSRRPKLAIHAGPTARVGDGSQFAVEPIVFRLYARAGG